MVVCGLAVPEATRQTSPSATRPHRHRRGANLVRNASFATPTGWTLLGGAVLDPAVSRGADGSGSLRLRTPIPNGSMVFSDYIPVRAGVQYTFSLSGALNWGLTERGGQVGLS
jgi:hypothetical protein